MIKIDTKKVLTGDPEWPVELVRHEHWLDSGVYMHRDRINQWLLEHDINFVQHQMGKTISWSLKSEEAATMFLLRWAD